MASPTSFGASPARLPSRSEPCKSRLRVTDKTSTAGSCGGYALCRSQLRNDQERLQKQVADAEHRSTELSAKLEQERMGKEDSVRMRSLPCSGLQPQFAESLAAA